MFTKPQVSLIAVVLLMLSLSMGAGITVYGHFVVVGETNEYITIFTKHQEEPCRAIQTIVNDRLVPKDMLMVQIYELRACPGDTVGQATTIMTWVGPKTQLNFMNNPRTGDARLDGDIEFTEPNGVTHSAHISYICVATPQFDPLYVVGKRWIFTNYLNQVRASGTTLGGITFQDGYHAPWTNEADTQECSLDSFHYYWGK